MACLSARGIVPRVRSNLADIPGTIHIGSARRRRTVDAAWVGGGNVRVRA